jgi:hypothetical protein
MGAHPALQVGVMRFSVRIRCAVAALATLTADQAAATEAKSNVPVSPAACLQRGYPLA